MKKKCKGACGLEKDLSEFHKHKNGKYGVRSRCKLCVSNEQYEYYENNKEKKREYDRQYRENNREKINENAKKSYIKNKDRKLKWSAEYRDKHRERINADQRQRTKNKGDFLDSFREPCIVCGESEKACIDFHHKDPSTKSFSIGSSKTKTYEELEKEINKCVCLCANCHRKYHKGLITIPS